MFTRTNRVQQRVRPALLLGALAVLAAPSAQAAPEGPTTVETQYGPVHGQVTPFGREFLGLRYAATTAGENRWRPPTAPATWTSEDEDATQFGPACPQASGPFSAGSLEEDCLFLNVYTPPTPFSFIKRPVMVWLHGGAFLFGEASDYDPARMVEQGVVVVTVNYRLGALGFLAHPLLTAEAGQSGNYGLMDQQFALQWIQRNIAAFGGNPDRVTIFGQSAGGLSVLSHLVSPGSAGLFHGAIVQSGAITLNPASQTQAQTRGALVVAQVAGGDACTDTACLRALAVEDILADQLLEGEISYFPNVDGLVLPGSIGAALATGNFNRVPVIHGTTHDEWSLFVALDELASHTPLAASDYEDAIISTLRLDLQVPDPGTRAAVVAAITSVYPLTGYPTPSEALTAVGTDAIFACNGYTAAQFTSLYVPTFYYEFNDPDSPILPSLALAEPLLSFPLRSYHTSEIPYTGLSIPPGPLGGVTFTPDQQTLSQFMVRYWTRFAKWGTPNGLGTPYWGQLNGLLIQDRVKSLQPPLPLTRIDYFEDEHRCAFWQQLFAPPAP